MATTVRLVPGVGHVQQSAAATTTRLVPGVGYVQEKSTSAAVFQAAWAQNRNTIITGSLR